MPFFFQGIFLPTSIAFITLVDFIKRLVYGQMLYLLSGFNYHLLRPATSIS